MAHHLGGGTFDSSAKDIHSKNVPEETSNPKCLNEAIKCSQLQKRLKECEAENAHLKQQIREIKDCKGQNSSARIMIQAYLDKFPLNEEAEALFESVKRVLDPNPSNFFDKSGHRAQQLPALETETAAGSVAPCAGPSSSRATEPPTPLSASHLRIKRTQVPNKIDTPKTKQNCKSAPSENIPMMRMRLRSRIAKKPIRFIDGFECNTKTKKISVTNSTETELPEITLICPQADQSVLSTSGEYSTSDVPAIVQADESSLGNLVNSPSTSAANKTSMESNPQGIISKMSLKSQSQIKKGPKKFVVFDNAVCKSRCLVSVLSWQMTYEKIKATPEIGETSLKVLHIISVLAPDNITPEFLSKLYRAIEDQENVTIGVNVFQLLSRLSVINFSLGNPVTVTPDVQKMIRIKVTKLGKFTEVLDNILAGARQMLKKNEIPSEEICHAETIWEHATKITELTQKYPDFPDKILSKLFDSGKNKDVQDFSDQVLSTLETWGENNKWILRMKYWKGKALENFGDYAESLELLNAVYKIQKKFFGDEDEHCLNTAEEIGVVHLRLESYEDARKWFEETLEKSERMNGKEHEGTLSLKNDIGVVLSGQGKYKEAMELLQQVLEVEERVLGVEHVETLSTKFNLAVAIFEQGEFKEALKIFQEVLQVKERVLEVDHPDFLLTKSWIATTYESLGRQEEAVELRREVWQKSEEYLGPEHPQTLSEKQILGSLLFDQGDYEEAIKMFEEVLQGRERVLGNDHPSTLHTKTSMANCRQVQVSRTEGRSSSTIQRSVAEKRQYPSTGTSNDVNRELQHGNYQMQLRKAQRCDVPASSTRGSMKLRRRSWTVWRHSLLNDGSQKRTNILEERSISTIKGCESPRTSKSTDNRK